MKVDEFKNLIVKAGYKIKTAYTSRDKNDVTIFYKEQSILGFSSVENEIISAYVHDSHEYVCSYGIENLTLGCIKVAGPEDFVYFI